MITRQFYPSLKFLTELRFQLGYDYMTRVYARTDFQPVQTAQKPHVIAFKFQTGLKNKLGEVQLMVFSAKQNGVLEKVLVSTRGEINHVSNYNKNAARPIQLKYQPQGEIHHVIGFSYSPIMGCLYGEELIVTSRLLSPRRLPLSTV